MAEDEKTVIAESEPPAKEHDIRYVDDGSRDAARVGCLILFMPIGIFLVTAGIFIYYVFFRPIQLLFLGLLHLLKNTFTSQKARTICK